VTIFSNSVDGGGNSNQLSRTTVFGEYSPGKYSWPVRYYTFGKLGQASLRASISRIASKRMPLARAL
jgi:hypothetical protein